MHTVQASNLIVSDGGEQLDQPHEDQATDLELVLLEHAQGFLPRHLHTLEALVLADQLHQHA